MRVFIIAEAGVNHNGSLELAYRLCDVALAAGADAVKFQTWKTDNIVTRSAAMATYQQENLRETAQSQYEMLKRLELQYDDFRQIKAYCDKIGICFLSTPDDEESLDFLLSLHLPVMKIGSGDVTNIPYLRRIAASKLRVILSTGMATLAEVDIAYRTLMQYGATDVALLHCTTNYPCPYENVNLRAMQTLHAAIGCEVGFSDHTQGIIMPVAAVAMGASIIEKHFTLDKAMDGPDHKASLDPDELRAMVQAIRATECAMGNGVKCPCDSEVLISSVVRKRIVANAAIKLGDVLTESNMTVKRCGDGMDAAYWDLLIGRTANRNYQKDEPIIL